MRPAQYSDLGYFVKAGEEFCQHTPFDFDPRTYAEAVARLIDDPDCISVVTGDPPAGHSVAKITPSFYNASELIARVFTTWGEGGLRCFVRLEELCRERGARFLVADSFIDPRIMRFYQRRGMRRADQLFIKVL